MYRYKNHYNKKTFTLPYTDTYYCYIYADNMCIDKTEALAYMDPVILNPDGTPKDTTKWLGPYNSIQECKTSNPYKGCQANFGSCEDIKDCCMTKDLKPCSSYNMYPTGEWTGMPPNYGCTPYPTQQCAFCGDNEDVGQGCKCNS